MKFFKFGRMGDWISRSIAVPGPYNHFGLKPRFSPHAPFGEAEWATDSGAKRILGGCITLCGRDCKILCPTPIFIMSSTTPTRLLQSREPSPCMGFKHWFSHVIIIRTFSIDKASRFGEDSGDRIELVEWSPRGPNYHRIGKHPTSISRTQKSSVCQQLSTSLYSPPQVYLKVNT